MKKTVIFLFLLTSAYVAVAQDAPRSTPLTTAEIISSSVSQGDAIKVELAHPNYFYGDNETIEVYGPNGKVDNVDFFCYGNDCEKTENEGELLYPKGDLGRPQVKYRHPLGLIFNKPVEKGIYEISIIRDGRVHHKRTFSVVDPEPVINSVRFNGYDGSASTEALKIDKEYALDKVKLTFGGANLATDFESVTIQNLPLKPSKEEPETYVPTSAWTNQAIANLNLGETEVIFKRKHTDKVTKYKIKLVADAPIINEPGLTFQAAINENKATITLSVQHLFTGARLILQNSDAFPAFLEQTGTLIANVNALSGTISKDVYFKSNHLIDNATFFAQVVNKDGKTSEVKTITISRKAENVSAEAYNNNQPLISGVENRVLFKRIGGRQFNLNTDNEFEIAINGFEPRVIQARRESDNAFSSVIDFPEGLPTNISFTLKKDKAVWNGSFKQILARPLVTIPAKQVYRGSSIKLNVQNAENVRVVSETPNDQLDIIETIHGPDKTFEVNVAKEIRLSQIKLRVLLKDVLIEEYAIDIANWPEPTSEKLGIAANNGAYSKKDDVIVLEDKSEISLSFQADSLRYLQHFSAQFIKNDGTRLGSPKPFIYNEETGKIETTLSTRQVGIQRGDAFNVEIANPTGDVILKPAYIKRSERDRWIITAGVSVLDVPFGGGSEENDESGASIFQGINLAGYYMFENVKNPENRYFGIGPNLLFSERDGDIKIGGAVSMLFFEKLVIGLSFDSDGPGLLIGANIQLANLSSLLGG